MKIKVRPFLLTLSVLSYPLLTFASPPSAARNPFKRQFTLEQRRPDSESPPLERYPLSDLRLTAIVADARGDVFASVENPEGVGFKVDVGTRLGTSRAKVIQITRRGLVIEERSLTAGGIEETTTKELLLRKP